MRRSQHDLDVESRCAVLLDECVRRGVPRWIALNLALVAMGVRPAVLVQSIDDDFGQDFASGVRKCAAAIRSAGVPLTYEIVDKNNGETDVFFFGAASRPLFDAVLSAATSREAVVATGRLLGYPCPGDLGGGGEARWFVTVSADDVVLFSFGCAFLPEREADALVGRIQSALEAISVRCRVSWSSSRVMTYDEACALLLRGDLPTDEEREWVSNELANYGFEAAAEDARQPGVGQRLQVWATLLRVCQHYPAAPFMPMSREEHEQTNVIARGLEEALYADAGIQPRRYPSR